MKSDGIGETDLHAFADGDLDADRAGHVGAYLATHPADAARVETWRRQNAAIRRAFATPVRDLPPIRAERRFPSGDEAVTRLDPIRVGRRGRWVTMTIVALVGSIGVVALGAVAVTRSADWLTPSATRVLPETAGGAARRALVAWQTFAEDADRAPARPQPFERSVLHRAGLSAAPDLSNQGFALLATHPMPGESAPAAFLLYAGSGGTRIAATAERTADADRAPSEMDEGGLRVVAWRSLGRSFTLVGRGNLASFSALARALGDAVSRDRP